MNKNKFLLIHTLIDVGINNSNRDDVGEVKSAMVGGRVRQRRSSQSKKRADRDAMVDIGGSAAYRTRKLPERLFNDLVAQGMDNKTAIERLGNLFASGRTKGKLIDKYADVVKTKDGKGVKTQTLIFYSQKEYDLMLEFLKNDAEEMPDIQRLLAGREKRFGGLIALFGRMMADHPSMNVDAAVQYSHGFSTHEISMESDYFTALDDLGEDETGAAHLDQTSFTQSVLFTSVAVDLEQLQKNLPDAEKDDIVKLLVSFVEAHLTSTPEGKKNSFFSSSLPQLAVVDVTNLPISMHGAFEKPVSASLDGGYMENSIAAFKEYRDQMIQRGYNVEQSIGGENYSLQAIKDFVAQIL